MHGRKGLKSNLTRQACGSWEYRTAQGNGNQEFNLNGYRSVT